MERTVQQKAEQLQHKITHASVFRRIGRGLYPPYLLGRGLYFIPSVKKAALDVDTREEIHRQYVQQHLLITAAQFIPIVGTWISWGRAANAVRPTALPKDIDLGDIPYFKGQRRSDGRYTVNNPVKATADAFGLLPVFPDAIGETIFRLVMDHGVFKGVEAGLAFHEPETFIKRQARLQEVKNQLKGRRVKTL